MQTDFLPFSKPLLSQATIDEVIACLQSGWLATGPRVKQFESDLKSYLHSPHALALTSATAGLHLSLLSLDLQPGDEVITSPMTYVATLNCIVQAGGKPVLADIDPKTYLIDVEKIRLAITPRTKAIVPIHFAGVPVDLDAIYQLAREHNLRVIEDAAHAIGTYYKNQIIGSFGDTQVFSFHPNKVMTSGEGGCITTRNEALVKFVNLMRFHGVDREAWNRFAKEGSQHYDVVAAGFKYNMMDIQAAIGIHQLAELEMMLEDRAKLGQRYNELLNDWKELTLPQDPNYPHRRAWYIYAPLINPEIANLTRDQFIQAMKDAGIGTGLHYEATHLYQFYREKFGYRAGDFPHAENVGQRIVSLPLYAGMTFEQQDKVIAAMKTIFGKV